MAKLDVKIVAMAAGITWSISMLFLGWVAIFGWGKAMVEVLSSLYIGYEPTLLGGVIGGLWGLIDGAIGGAIFALIYNRIVKD